jgi:C4-dicarboxylate transporter DctQ subunit
VRVLKFIDEQFEKWALIASLIVMVLLTFMQVVLRWFGNATVWAEELSRYIMLYQVWVGASYAVHEDAHIRITALVGKLRGSKKQVSEVVVLAIWLVFAIWLTAEGVVLVNKIALMGQVSSAMRIPMTIPYASVPVGGALMSIRLIQKLVEKLKNKPEEKKEEVA